MRSLLVLALLTLPLVSAGCVDPFDPDPWCPRPIEECEYGYLSSTAVDEFEGKWNMTRTDEVLTDYGFTFHPSYLGTREEYHPITIVDGHKRYYMGHGIWRDTHDRGIDIRLGVENWTGDDKPYNITMNLTYLVDHDRMHYLPLDLAEEDRDRHRAIIEAFHEEFRTHLTTELGWTPTNETSWTSEITEKTDRLREYEQRPWWLR